MPTLQADLPQTEAIQALMLLVCERHASVIEEILDASGFPSWTHMPAVQSRREHFLQNIPRRHPDQCAVFYAFGTAESVGRATVALAEAREAEQICAECVAVSWGAGQLLKAELELDPVCETVVAKAHSVAYPHHGQEYHFCSPECRQSFIDAPDEVLERFTIPWSVGNGQIKAGPHG